MRVSISNSYFFRALLTKEGFNIGKSQTNIIPIIIGDPKKTIKISKNLEKKGFFISPIRPPSVPPNSSRLRISITSLHTNKLIKKLFNTLKGFKNEI